MVENKHFLNEPVIFIEQTNICNLRCPICPSNNEMTRSKGLMKRETFEKIIDELGGQKPFLNFWGWGEPFLHPEIFSLVKYASDAGVKVRLSTNLEKVHQNVVPNLVNSGLDTLLFSFDGFSQGVYGSYRVGGKVEHTKMMAREIIDFKMKSGIEKPYLVAITLITKSTLPELDDIVGYCHSVGVDAVLLKYPNLWRSGKSGKRALDLYQQFIIEDPAMSRYQAVNDDVRESVEPINSTGCLFHDKNGVILWNGDVTVCCYDHNGKHAFGNVSEGGYKQVLTSPAKKDKWVNMETKQLDICRYCDASGPRTKTLIFNKNLKPSNLVYL